MMVSRLNNETKKEQNMNITIINVKNADELDSFVPVDGQWSADDYEGVTMESVEQSVCNYMDVDYPLEVQVFHKNGHAITGDMPLDGAFLVTRK